MTRRWKILLALVAVLAAAILFVAIRHYQLRASPEAYIAQLKAKGEPMDLAQVLPPPVPPDQNSADTLRQAFALIDADPYLLGTDYYGVNMMKPIAPGKTMICSQQPDDKEWDVTNSWQDLRKAVDQNQKIFDLLRKTVARPDVDFGIQYDQGVAALDFKALGLPESKRAALWLSAAIACDLHKGDTASAIENLRAMLAIAQALRDQRLIISELVRMAIVHIAVAANWEILQSPNLNNDELAQLEHDWQGFNFTYSSEKAFEMERVTSGITTRRWRNSYSAFGNLNFPLSSGGNLATFWNSTKNRTEFVAWRYWWSYPDELQALKGYEAIITAMRMAQTNGSIQNAIQYEDGELNELGLTNLDESLVLGEPDFQHLLSETIPVLGAVMGHVMSAEAAQQIVITSIALKRYQLKHGNYPATLASLVPEFLPAVPLDPVDGKPLHYHPNADGTFLLYSVGPNGKDDGGNPSLETGVEGRNSLYWLNPHALDWVWPQPATAAEIKSFYAHPAK